MRTGFDCSPSCKAGTVFNSLQGTGRQWLLQRRSTAMFSHSVGCSIVMFFLSRHYVLERNNIAYHRETVALIFIFLKCKYVNNRYSNVQLCNLLYMYKYVYLKNPTEVVAADGSTGSLVVSKELFPQPNFSFLNRISHIKQLPSCPHEAGWTSFQTLYSQENFQDIAGNRTWDLLDGSQMALTC